MFEKNNNGIKVDIKKANLYKTNNILLSSSFVDMMSLFHSEEDLKIQNVYQEQITSFINNIDINNDNKEYNPTIVNLYKNGKLIIGSEEYKLKDFYIIFNDKLNNFNLQCIDKRLNTKNKYYNKAIKFIDTTSFINLVNASEIKDNKIIISDINKLNEVIIKWEGYIHNEVSETDAIVDKKVIKDGVNG